MFINTFPKVADVRYIGILAIGISFFISSCGTSSRMQDPNAPNQHDWDSDAPGQIIEEGIASWYGPKFHGKPTANGEQYDMDQLTAAHRTLPFNSIVKVKNLANGQSVTVRINDRGPFAKNRIIDLSKKAAREIGMIGSGTANVVLLMMNENLGKLQMADLKTATYTVQLGSFVEKAKALKRSRNIEGSRVERVQRPSHTHYRVYYGTFMDKSEARKSKEELEQRGYNGYIKQLQN